MPVSDELWRTTFIYDQITGVIMWRVKPRSFKEIRPAGHNDGRGYIKISLNRERVYAHRLAWFLHYGRWPISALDHINGNPSDNRIANLRECTPSQNVQNISKARGLSRFKGVQWHTACQKWVATIKKNGNSKHLGLFCEEADAAIAYNNAAISEFGEFACLNEVVPVR